LYDEEEGESSSDNDDGDDDDDSSSDVEHVLETDDDWVISGRCSSMGMRSVRPSSMLMEKFMRKMEHHARIPDGCTVSEDTLNRYGLEHNVWDCRVVSVRTVKSVERRRRMMQENHTPRKSCVTDESKGYRLGGVKRIGRRVVGQKTSFANVMLEDSVMDRCASDVASVRMSSGTLLR
jgi:hypothetical protein